MYNITPLPHLLIFSLRIDSSKVRKVLGWRPPFTVEEGIRETVSSTLLQQTTYDKI